MNIREAYNIWADQYDSNENKTRDLEAVALRNTLRNVSFENCLEIGCGTGKNTEWLLQHAKQVTAIDLSNEMLAKARTKIIADHVKFIEADITKEWRFDKNNFDLVTFSLVLEHIEYLGDIFIKIKNVTKRNAYVYIGELHPFKQYSGSKARFETARGTNIVTCFNHNISDFTNAAKENGFTITEISEHFDNNDRTTLPRILTLLLQKEQD